MDWSSWLDAYFERFQPAFDERVRVPLEQFHDLACDVRARKGKLILAGNGASASIASHGAVDFSKQAKVRAVDFNEPNLITAFSNDYGFENWIARALDVYADPGDALILISVSGSSPNVLAAAQKAKELNLPIIAFSGKDASNPLNQTGDIQFHMPSHAYNIVEAAHMLWLTTVIDMLVGRAEYAVN